MHQIEVRIHDEINDYKEKFYGFTIRQWIAMIIMGAINVPLYLFSTPLIGEDLASYLVILIAIPIGVIGFIPIQQLPAEKMLLYIWRSYVTFAKVLCYKTHQQEQAEQDIRRSAQVFKIENKRFIFSLENLKVKLHTIREALKAIVKTAKKGERKGKSNEDKIKKNNYFRRKK